MYFNNSNNFFHGIMFHHFHDDGIHLKSQGSISKDDFKNLINFIGRKNILSADDFYEKFKKDLLKKNEVCITFDDAIKSQIDVALPVLSDYKIKAFFFVYTSMFEGNPDNLEIYRYFRTNYFSSINEFYSNFYEALNENLEPFFIQNQKEIENKKLKFQMYTLEDIKFRLVRDLYLKKDEYEDIMQKMMKKKKIISSELYSKLFFSKDDLKKLDKQGHLIGPHSHFHPTLMENLTTYKQKYEYEKAISVLSKILNKSKSDFKWMSHPNGSYSKDTLKVLNKIGFKLGFKQIMKIEPEKGMKKINNSNLEIAREDHSNIIRLMN